MHCNQFLAHQSPGKRILPVGVLVLLTPMLALAQSLTEGAYTEEQALLGQVLYYQHCLACHGEMMEGVDQAPPLAGPQFSSTWNGVSLLALVERMETMPPDKPGTLSRQDNVDLLTYMLWYNGLPLGSKTLAAERDVLADMTFETTLGR